VVIVEVVKYGAMYGQDAPSKWIESNISARRRAPIVKASRSAVRRGGSRGWTVGSTVRSGVDGGMVGVSPGRSGDTVGSMDGDDAPAKMYSFLMDRWYRRGDGRGSPSS